MRQSETFRQTLPTSGKQGKLSNCHDYKSVFLCAKRSSAEQKASAQIRKRRHNTMAKNRLFGTGALRTWDLVSPPRFVNIGRFRGRENPPGRITMDPAVEFHNLWNEISFNWDNVEKMVVIRWVVRTRLWCKLLNILIRWNQTQIDDYWVYNFGVIGGREVLLLYSFNLW